MTAYTVTIVEPVTYHCVVKADTPETAAQIALEQDDDARNWVEIDNGPADWVHVHDEDGEPTVKAPDRPPVWTITTDDKNGHECRVFWSMSQADDVALEWLTERWCEDLHGPMPDCITDALNTYYDRDPQDFIWYEVHQ